MEFVDDRGVYVMTLKLQLGMVNRPGAILTRRVGHAMSKFVDPIHLVSQSQEAGPSRSPRSNSFTSAREALPHHITSVVQPTMATKKSLELPEHVHHATSRNFDVMVADHALDVLV